MLEQILQRTERSELSMDSVTATLMPYPPLPPTDACRNFVADRSHWLPPLPCGLILLMQNVMEGERLESADAVRCGRARAHERPKSNHQDLQLSVTVQDVKIHIHTNTRTRVVVLRVKYIYRGVITLDLWTHWTMTLTPDTGALPSRVHASQTG
jgi:hypothetical protein